MSHNLYTNKFVGSNAVFLTAHKFIGNFLLFHIFVGGGRELTRELNLMLNIVNSLNLC